MIELTPIVVDGNAEDSGQGDFATMLLLSASATLLMVAMLCLVLSLLRRFKVHLFSFFSSILATTVGGLCCSVWVVVGSHLCCPCKSCTVASPALSFY